MGTSCCGTRFTLYTLEQSELAFGFHSTIHARAAYPIRKTFKRPVSSELKQKASYPPARQPNLETEEGASGDEGYDVQEEASGITGNVGEEPQVEERNAVIVGEDPQVEARNAAIVSEEPQVE
eukprot:gene19925-23840_t